MEVIELINNNSFFKATYFKAEKHKGNILVCPAMGITAKYYTHWATWLNERGYNILVMDYQGTGMSEQDNIKKCKATFMDWVGDMTLAGKWLKEQSTEKSLIFVGHSIGSQLFGFMADTKLFDKAVFIASSTGYWKDAHSPQKWINYFLLNMVLPMSNLIWGFTNAKFFKQGENYPKYPALQWRKWCLNKEYLKIDLHDSQANNYNLYDRQITSIWFTDDPVANEITAPKLVNIYKKATVNLIKIAPKECNTSKIGHVGFTSRKLKDSLWNVIIEKIEA